MNNKELQATRKLLMLDVSEAAELVGKVSPRTWQYWESGRYNIPADVADEMQDLLSMRLELMNSIDKQLAKREDVSLPFHPSFETYEADNPGSTKIDWRLSQSVAALYYTEGHASLK